MILAHCLLHALPQGSFCMLIYITITNISALNISRYWEKKRKEKSKCHTYISFVPLGVQTFIDCKCSFPVKFFSSSKSFLHSYLYLAPSRNWQDWSFGKWPENYLDTIYKDNLTAIHLGSPESPINNTCCQRAKLKLKRGHCSKSGLKVWELLPANEILGKKDQLG